VAEPAGGNGNGGAELIERGAIDKARALVEALGYIQRFHDKVVVVKVGGSIMDDEAALSALLNDIVFMNYVGMSPVLVHGGGKAINDAMEKAGLQPQWVQGRRYTDDRTIAIAEHVLCNQVNKAIVAFIQARGARRWACTRSAPTSCWPRRRT
jgi:acetylglutamate kinase